MSSGKLSNLLAIGTPLLLTICVLVAVFLLTRPVQMSETDEILEDCAGSFCGCWEASTLAFSATIVNQADEPIRGIKLYCDGEQDPIAISNREGAITFTIETSVSPGCQYLRCTNLEFSDPDHRYKTLQTTVFLTNQSTVALQPIK